MPSNRKPLALADPRRFKTIQDLTKMRPDCGASIDDFFVIDNELLLIIDIVHIGSTLNPYNSPAAFYVRTHGVIVQSIVWAESRPIFWREPFLLLPLSCHLEESMKNHEDIGNLAGRVSCFSGTILMMPIRRDIPTPLGGLMDEALAKKVGARIKVPSGTYRVFYEQFETPEGAKKELYQNIVAQRQ